MRYWQVVGPVKQKDGRRVDETQYVAAEEAPTIEDAVVTEVPRLPEDGEKVVDGEIVPDLDYLRSAAVAYVDRKQEAAADKLQKLVMNLATLEVWREIKQLERDSATGQIPGTQVGRQEEYPFLSSLASVAAVSLEVAATTAKAEIQPAVKRMALFAARALVARRKIAQAQTAEEIKSAAGVNLEA